MYFPTCAKPSETSDGIFPTCAGASEASDGIFQNRADVSETSDGIFPTCADISETSDCTPSIVGKKFFTPNLYLLSNERLSIVILRGLWGK